MDCRKGRPTPCVKQKDSGTRGLEPGALCYGEGDRRAGKSQAGGRAPWCHNLLTWVVEMNIRHAPGWAWWQTWPAGPCHPALLQFWLLSSLLFFKSASLPRAEYLRLCRCDMCYCIPLNPPQSQEDFFEAFCSASLAPGHVMSPEQWRQSDGVKAFLHHAALCLFLFCICKQLYKDHLGTG